MWRCGNVLDHGGQQIGRAGSGERIGRARRRPGQRPRREGHSLRGTVRQAQLANAAKERPQTKNGGISVGTRIFGRLINKSSAFFRAPPSQKFSHAAMHKAWPAAGAEKIQALATQNQFSSEN